MNKKFDRNYLIQNPTKLIQELKTFCKDVGITGVVLGISGGKDSTIVAKLMCDVLGVDNVFGVLIPNGNQEDINDSQRVIELLGIKSININIQNPFQILINNINMEMGKSEVNHFINNDAIINLPPRLRMTTLYAVAQSLGHGWRVAGTTNRSEEYIGWVTKWGDGACDFEPIIDFTVTELYQLGVNLGLPKNFVYKTPLDGLAQGSDEERFGFTYYQLDTFIENGTCGDMEIDEKIKKMHKYSQHKRDLIPAFNLN